MSRELHERHWFSSARERAEEGVLDRMVSEELFDHTWRAAVHELERNLRVTAGQRILDAGCGWGRLVFGMTYFHPNVSIDGYELTPEFADKAREILRQNGLDAGVSITEADLLDVDLPSGHYDSFYCSRVLHYIEAKERFVRKLHSSLKEGGRGMIIIPNRNSPRQRLRYKHAPLYPIRSVGAIMEAVGFTGVYYGGYRMLPSSPRFSHDSPAGRLETSLASTPLGRFGGLAYAVGTK